MGFPNTICLGNVFFAKVSKEWEEIARLGYEELVILEKPTTREIPNINQKTCGSISDGKGFEFGLWYVFYKT